MGKTYLSQMISLYGKPSAAIGSMAMRRSVAGALTEQVMALSNVLMKLRIYLGLLLLPFTAIPLFALDFEEGQAYCVGSGERDCGSVWTVKAIEPDGLIFDEQFRMTTPLDVMQWRQINWNVKRVKLTSRYAYEG